MMNLGMDFEDADAIGKLLEETDIDFRDGNIFLDGENVYDTSLTNDGIIVMGSEGRGISSEVRAAVSHKLLIPNYPEGEPTSESLNVSTATAIICAEFRRRSR